MTVSLEWLGALARYNRWMNEKLFAHADALGDEARKRDVGAYFRSIHGTLNHILLADRVWLARLEGVTAPEGLMAPGIHALDQELFADFDDLRRERAATDDALSAYVAALTPERLEDALVFTRRGQVQEAPRWWALVHVFNHQTHHRGQITTMLVQQGRDPGVTDLYAMLREERLAGG